MSDIGPQENQEREPLQPSYTGLDVVLEKVGSYGRYQIITFIIFSLQWFCVSWLLTGGGFFFDEVEFSCPDEKWSPQQCQDWVCSLDEPEWWNYIKPGTPKIIANSFGTLYACSKDYVLTILSSIVYIGSFVGFFIFPYIADNFGRKLAINASWLTCCAGVILSAFSQNVYMVGAGWFLGGFGGNPAITLSYSFINQQSLGKSRQYFSIGIQLWFAVGESIIGFIFKAFGDWKPISYMLIGIFLFTALTQLYLLETPRFMVKKSLDETLKIYNTIAYRNGKTLIRMKDLKEALQEEPVEVTGNSSLIDLFKYPSLRWKNQICGFIFFAIQLVYYSTTFNLGNIAFDPYINQFIVGMSELAGYIAAELLIPRVKRKICSYVGMGLTGIFCFILISVEGGKNAIVSAILLCAMRFFVAGFWAMFYVYQAELFPTKVRSLAMGWSSALGTIGSTLSPYSLKLAKDTFHMSTWILPGAVAILATISVKPLKETFNKKLQDDIQEQKASLISKQSQISTNQEGL